MGNTNWDSEGRDDECGEDGNGGREEAHVVFCVRAERSKWDVEFMGARGDWDQSFLYRVRVNERQSSGVGNRERTHTDHCGFKVIIKLQ